MANQNGNATAAKVAGIVVLILVGWTLASTILEPVLREMAFISSAFDTSRRKSW